ncbi:endo-1,3-beta glucanase [Didymella pomorum]|uniref:Glucan endo-1,3-beta-D-glucosidase 1 n=1 Tax=Didymella pomorum TaxID=749634 RepID=A0A9W8ZPS8_9PLEO|nr:endo-1,3-beta glucanase [Didymella pomorum]
MAKLSLLLAISQLTLVLTHPAGDLKRQAVSVSTNLQATTSYTASIETVQTPSTTTRTPLTGSIPTALPTAGGITKDPANPPSETKTTDPLCPEESGLNPGPTEPIDAPSRNIFSPLPLDTPVPAPSIPFRGDHPVQKQNIVDSNVPIQTNKFYANFFLGSRSQSVWTHPYSLSWPQGRGTYGMAISHTERSQYAFGPNPASPQYFISPIGVQHMTLSAAELREGTVMNVDNLKAFSVYANFAASPGARTLMSIPVVQGMGMITAVYDGAQPELTSGVFFRKLQYAGPIDDRGLTYKYVAVLEDNSQWPIYVTPLRADGEPFMNLTAAGSIVGPKAFTGLVQVTKNPAGPEGEKKFDVSAGTYANEAAISASVNGGSGSYTMSWTKEGITSRPLIMYALPHHVESFDQETRGAMTGIQLITTTKGAATAVQADRFTMIEGDLPTTIGFAPWAKAANGAQGGTENVNLAPSALQLVNAAGTSELRQDFISQTSLNSMYYSGKGLAKFAGIIYTMQTMAGNSNLAAAGLDKLKDAFNVFVNNTQPEPLVYDTVWKGVVSGASYKGNRDLGLDFGNTAYNDHHFHYGYFVYTAAVIGHLDPSWLNEGTNKQWVNTLVRDYANPVTDEYFPFSRSFDWFHGHSWAKGLFESGDGKDQESTSEDTFATFALKMWGKISGDANMEARGNLQLAVQARSVNNYFLLKANNANQPAQFLFNKVTGILFENKCDHVTYFGTNIEYIQGIHMIPLNPSSAYTRPKDFVTEEWNAYFSNGRVDQVAGGWRGILYANLALIDPQTSYNYFASDNFDYGSLDGGASRTWYLAYSASMLNLSAAKAEQEATLYYPPQQQPDQQNQPSQQFQQVASISEIPAPAQPTQVAPQPQPSQQPEQQQPQDQPQQPEQQPQPQQEQAPEQTPPSQQQSAEAPYTDPAAQWINYEPSESESIAVVPTPTQDAYSDWRSYFNNYRNNALNGDKPRQGNPWDVPYAGPYNRAAMSGADGAAEPKPEAADEGEWEDVLDCEEIEQQE